MSHRVDITFDCIPLRSVTRLEPPADASPGFRALLERLRKAIEKHGRHNTYYLHNAGCTYHLTNSEQVGLLDFQFEGTVLTDPEDRKALQTDIEVRLRRETCDWLTEPVVAWFAETVQRAVLVEFNAFADSGDLQRTIERMARLEKEAEEHGGYVGMGL